MISLENINKLLEHYPSYRREQVYDAMFKKLCDNWDQATNLPAELKLKLNLEAPLEIKNKIYLSDSDNSVKALIYLDNGKCIETVLLSLNGRHSVCVSTQVGCPLGCTFCDSGRSGFIRNLDISEIIAQVLFFSRYLKQHNKIVTNIIYMGMGEPLLNYDNVIDSIKLLSSKKTLGLSLRRFSISSSGILPGIKRLSEEGLPINLAISLHSAIDRKRSSLMPINIQYPLMQLSK